MQGDPSAMPQTYKGTLAIDEYGQRRIKSKRDDIEEGINQLARLVVQLIQATYTSMKVLRLLQPNHKPKEIKINEPVYDDISGQFLGKLNDVTVGKYDVLVVSGSTLPSNRYARFEYYMELYKSGIIDQIEVLKQTEVANVEDVLNRSSKMSQLTSQVEGQSKQIKDLQGDLQTARRELVHARQRVEVEKFKTELEQSSNRADMASKLYAARTDDELKKVKNVVAEQEATNDEIIPLEE
jgi:flagellar biosynthesis chaperone FliJ